MTLILSYLFLIILAAFIGGILAKLIKEPPIVGYLIAGVILSIFWPRTSSVETINFLSELGIILLLFTIGLEFSISKLQRVVKISILGGVLQILITTFLGLVIVHQFGFTIYESLFMAAAFSLSSTAIVVKILSDKQETDTLPGEIMIGWSVVQDLLVLPLIILLPEIGRQFFGLGNSVDLFELLRNLGFAFGMLAIVIIIGRELVPKLINFVAKLNSRELLLVAVFGLALGFAILTQFLGLSPALGAFLAGLLISESAQVHAIFSEIRPLREIFSLLFFTTLALIVPTGFFANHFIEIILITGLVMLLKFTIVTLIAIFFGYHAKTTFLVSMGLINVGEFAFILARVGYLEKIISLDVYGMILSVAVVSIILMPPLFLTTPYFYLRAREYTKRKLPKFYYKFFSGFDHRTTLSELPYKDHVVLCGYGRVGKYVGRALEMMKIPCVVIEYNFHKFNELKDKGIEVVYGDPADLDILDFAQVDKAKAIVIAIPDFETQKMVITNSQNLNKNIQIFCRSHKEENQRDLKALGVNTIIQPEFEASLSITSKILKSFGGKNEEIEGKISRLKIEHGLSSS